MLPLASRDIAVTDEFRGRCGDIQRDQDEPVTTRLKDRTDALTGTVQATADRRRDEGYCGDLPAPIAGC